MRDIKIPTLAVLLTAAAVTAIGSAEADNIFEQLATIVAEETNPTT